MTCGEPGTLSMTWRWPSDKIMSNLLQTRAEKGTAKSGMHLREIDTHMKEKGLDI